ncbi:MAG: 23S rRNA (pseudouridine(1915)-N(3))-methyltransferase RlmH [Bacteroidales bacterium]|nr:23S rRNA (pseudouridine(1915)-N(3))-methyltransferase RlmH [Bacteroidales bacterium]
MRLTIIFTGKTKAGYLKEGVDEYTRRVARYAPLSVVVIPDLKVSARYRTAAVKKLEGQQILARIKSSDHVVLLDEGGKMVSSVEFSGYLSGLEGRTGHCVFVIGGAYGFSEEVYGRANDKLSLSRMTFSHQMVRLIFSEQLYRAFTILKGEPYHHT